MNTQSPVTYPFAGSSRRWLIPTLYAFIILAVVAGFAALRWVNKLPERIDDQQTVVVGRTRFAPDSDASVRVVVQDFGAGEPIVGAQVKISLKPATGKAIPLFEEQTDETGSLPVSFHVPADAPAEAQLVVETEAADHRLSGEFLVRDALVFQLPAADMLPDAGADAPLVSVNTKEFCQPLTRQCNILAAGVHEFASGACWMLQEEI